MDRLCFAQNVCENTFSLLTDRAAGLPLLPAAQNSLPAGQPLQRPGAEMPLQRAGPLQGDGTLLSVFPSVALVHPNSSVHTHPQLSGTTNCKLDQLVSVGPKKDYYFLTENELTSSVLGTSPVLGSGSRRLTGEYVKGQGWRRLSRSGGPRMRGDRGCPPVLTVSLPPSWSLALFLFPGHSSQAMPGSRAPGHPPEPSGIKAANTSPLSSLELRLIGIVTWNLRSRRRLDAKVSLCWLN